MFVRVQSAQGQSRDWENFLLYPQASPESLVSDPPFWAMGVARSITQQKQQEETGEEENKNRISNYSKSVTF